jgi:hypothetical protein
VVALVIITRDLNNSPLYVLSFRANNNDAVV